MKIGVAIAFFVGWSALIYYLGITEGKKNAKIVELERKVYIYAKTEENTREQEKTAEKIIVKYKTFKSNNESCNYVLNFDVSSCLPK